MSINTLHRGDDDDDDDDDDDNNNNNNNRVRKLHTIIHESSKYGAQ
jgi:hypothetical protein